MRVLGDREAEIVARARAGDSEAQGEIYGAFRWVIYAFIYRMVGDEDEAENLTQDTFMRAFRGLSATREDTNVSAWLHRIASNACLDVLRRRQRLRWQPWEGEKHDHLVVSTALDDPERSAERRETILFVRRVMDQMSSRHRLGLMLREYEGLSCAEIGEVMGLSRTAVKSMLFRAREEFRAVYARLEQEDREWAGAAA
jgi:RNA polymerase sigma-70 factor (ECF subfamily)